MSKPATRGTLRRDSARGIGTIRIPVPGRGGSAAGPTAAPRTTGDEAVNGSGMVTARSPASVATGTGAVASGSAGSSEGLASSIAMPTAVSRGAAAG
jgi:hypothetical protein